MNASNRNTESLADENRPDLTALTSYGRNAGSARVRIFEWLEFLSIRAKILDYTGDSSNSFHTMVSQPIPVVRAEARLRALSSNVSGKTVLLSRRASPFSRGRIEEKILSRAQHAVYDFDDALMFPSAGFGESLWSKSRVWRRSVEASDVVIAGNDYLADQAEEFNNSVVVIPSCVDPSSYLVKHDFGISEDPVAVWMGSPGTEHLLADVTRPLLEMHKALRLRLRVISAGQAPLGDLEQMVDRETWSGATFGTSLASADFGIMPLSDSAWNRGKCAYKLLQYGAAGLPMVGSPVGVNREVLSLADGLQATTNDEWAAALESLILESGEQRRARGEAGRAMVLSKYSYAAWENPWRSALGLVD